MKLTVLLDSLRFALGAALVPTFAASQSQRLNLQFALGCSFQPPGSLQAGTGTKRARLAK